MTSKKLPRRFEARAKIVKEQLRQLGKYYDSTYSPEAKRRNYPHRHGPVVRELLRTLRDELLPLPPDGKTARERQQLASLAKQRARDRARDKRAQGIVKRAKRKPKS